VLQVAVSHFGQGVHGWPDAITLNGGANGVELKANLHTPIVAGPVVACLGPICGSETKRRQSAKLRGFATSDGEESRLAMAAFE
jgi:hypothetical protein